MARSIRQSAVANLTPDAELAALAMAFRAMTIPAIDLWEVLLPVPVTCYVHEDNSACISVVTTGKNPTMRYIGRTQGINIQLLHEVLGTINPDCPCSMVKTQSADLVADVHTKGFTKSDEWNHVCRNANMFYAKDFDEVFGDHSIYFDKQKDAKKENIGIRPDIVHEVHEYLLGSRPDGDVCTSNTLATAPDSAVACPCVSIDADMVLRDKNPDDPRGDAQQKAVAKNFKGLKVKCELCKTEKTAFATEVSAELWVCQMCPTAKGKSQLTRLVQVPIRVRYRSKSLGTSLQTTGCTLPKPTMPRNLSRFMTGSRLSMATSS